ncbi:MAG: DUF4142 domain-containing protein [Pseudomonadota bacterium]|jgi:putative membrane protein
MADQEKHGGLKGAANKAQDAIGGMMGVASAATTGAHDAKTFVSNACVSDLYEIEAARIALRRSRSEGVREFADRMIAHHTTAKHQMMSALRSREVTDHFKNLSPVTELDARRKTMLKHLEEAPDDDFDKTYVDQQKLAHQEAVTLHKSYADRGENPQLRSVAAGGLPMVQRHAAALERIGVH